MCVCAGSVAPAIIVVSIGHLPSFERRREPLCLGRATQDQFEGCGLICSAHGIHCAKLVYCNRFHTLFPFRGRNGITPHTISNVINPPNWYASVLCKRLCEVQDFS